MPSVSYGSLLRLQKPSFLTGSGVLQRLDASQLLALARLLGCHVGVSPFLLVQLLHTRINLVISRPSPGSATNLEWLHQRLNLGSRRAILLQHFAGFNLGALL